MGYSQYPSYEDLFYSIPGTGNQARQAACEDVIWAQESQTLRFYGLADGQTGKPYCREGAQACLEALFRYLSERGIQALRAYEYLDEIQYEIIRLIRRTIAALAAERQAEKPMFASTLVAFAFDRRTGDYITVHLGDGAIIGRGKGEIRMISAPENGLTANYTWLTTSREALGHLRIGFGNISQFERILMITDGASSIAMGRFISEEAEALIEGASRTRIAEFMAESRPEDDASCVIIDFSSPVCYNLDQ